MGEITSGLEKQIPPHVVFIHVIFLTPQVAHTLCDIRIGRLVVQVIIKL